MPGPGRALVGPAATGSAPLPRPGRVAPRRVEPTRCGRRRGWTFARHRLPCPLQGGGRGTPVGAGAARAHLLRSVDRPRRHPRRRDLRSRAHARDAVAHVSHAACGGRSARFRAGGARTATGPAAPTEGNRSRIPRGSPRRAASDSAWSAPVRRPTRCSCRGLAAAEEGRAPAAAVDRRLAQRPVAAAHRTRARRAEARNRDTAGGPRGAGTRPRRTVVPTG